MDNPDLVTVAFKYPSAVVCLISALSFHELTMQIPHKAWIAVPKGAETPRIQLPPLSVHPFSGASYSEGIEEHLVDGVPVKIYAPEKTLADCIKFRNKIGVDIVAEAPKFYKTPKTSSYRQTSPLLSHLPCEKSYSGLIWMPFFESLSLTIENQINQMWYLRYINHLC